MSARAIVRDASSLPWASVIARLSVDAVIVVVVVIGLIGQVLIGLIGQSPGGS